MLKPGDKAPDFVGTDHMGKTVKLSDFKGKPVVLWFYPEGRHPWLNRRRLRVPRPEGGLRPEERGDPRRVLRYARREQEVRGEVQLQLPSDL